MDDADHGSNRSVRILNRYPHAALPPYPHQRKTKSPNRLERMQGIPLPDTLHRRIFQVPRLFHTRILHPCVCPNRSQDANIANHFPRLNHPLQRRIPCRKTLRLRNLHAHINNVPLDTLQHRHRHLLPDLARSQQFRRLHHLHRALWCHFGTVDRFFTRCAAARV